jgi:flagellar operon protein
MNWDAKRIQANLGAIDSIQKATQKPKPTKSSEASDVSFQKTLENARESAKTFDVNISSHAADRLLRRGIQLDQSDLQKISDGFDRAATKGAKDSLFMLRDLALIVSVENRTVITALHGQNARDNVFTQIDSAVLL